MKFKYIVSACLIAIMGWACGNEDLSISDNTKLKVNVNITSGLTVRSAATATEKAVNSFDLFLFDATSGLLETEQQNIEVLAVSKGEAAGELNIGTVNISVNDAKAKNLLVVANRTAATVLLPEIKTGVTTYSDMMNAVALLSLGGFQAENAIVMSGYVNGIKASESPSVAVTLARRVSKITVVNPYESSKLTVTDIMVKNVADRTFLFSKGVPDVSTGMKYVDYTPQTVGGNAVFYLFPQPAQSNSMILKVTGTLAGVPFVKELPLKPVKDGAVQDMENNAHYTVNIKVSEDKLSLEVEVKNIPDWSDGGGMDFDVNGGTQSSEIVSFNGLQWMDRNLGASTADLENDWNNAVGKFYQWGRNIAFGTSEFETVSGPLTADAVGDANTGGKFISKMSGDWLDGVDDTRWQSVASQPCPEGYRMPTSAEFMEIFTASGVLVNMVNGPVSKTENLTGGSFTAQYWGDKTNMIYGLKKSGSDNAFYVKWEYMTPKATVGYLKISRWAADSNATFTGKSLSDVQALFVSLGAADETITFAAAGYLAGSNGVYGGAATGGYYWSSSISGSGAVRAEFGIGKMVAGETYNSRVSGHSVRCVKL